jgi:arsenate reductase
VSTSGPERSLSQETTPSEEIRVLFISLSNAVRSQMAEAFLRTHGGERFSPHSAGLAPRLLHPLTTTVMREHGITLRGHYAKGLVEFRGKIAFDYTVTLSRLAEQRCPVFRGMGQRLTWPFEDPDAFSGSDDRRLRRFREVRDAIELFIIEWVASLDATGGGVDN